MLLSPKDKLSSRVQHTFERPPKMFSSKTGICNSIDFEEGVGGRGPVGPYLGNCQVFKDLG